MRSFQTTTHIGAYSLLAGFLNTFQDVKLEHFWDVFTGLTCGELISMLLPFLIGLWAILHDETRLNMIREDIMSVEQQQEIIQLIEQLADRTMTCENNTDKELMAKAIGHLINYQATASKEII